MCRLKWSQFDFGQEIGGGAEAAFLLDVSSRGSGGGLQNGDFNDVTQSTLASLAYRIDGWEAPIDTGQCSAVASSKSE
jgi:hypothetical protein